MSAPRKDLNIIIFSPGADEAAERPATSEAARVEPRTADRTAADDMLNPAKEEEKRKFRVSERINLYVNMECVQSVFICGEICGVD